MGYKAGEPDAIFGFRWWVAEDGYRWVKARPVEARPVGPPRLGSPTWILAVENPHGRAKANPHLPLQDHPALFREFASLDTTREAILAFASRYGWLGHTVEFPGKPVRARASEKLRRPKLRRPAFGEKWGLWQAEIGAIREAVTLWELVQARKTVKLGRFFRWEGDNKDHFVYRNPERPGRFVLIASPEYEPELFAVCRKGDVVWPATAYVQHLINEHLADRTSPRLLRGEGGPSLRLYFTPRTLLGAMWLQLARAVDGNKEYRRCRRDGCEKLFEVSLDATGSRTDRLHCEDACKSKVFRERVVRARQLAAQGSPLREIASRLGADLETIRGWVGKRKEKRRTP